MKADSGISEETLADHPAQRDTRKVVASVIGNGTATDVCGDKCKGLLFRKQN